jgi:hypothetical protein
MKIEEKMPLSGEGIFVEMFFLTGSDIVTFLSTHA